MESLRNAAVALVLLLVVVFAVLTYSKVHKVSGQVGDVTGLVSDQSHRVNELLGTELGQLNTVLSAAAVTQAKLDKVYREVHRVLRRFQLLFRRVLRGLHGKVPEQTATLIRSIERGLRALLKRR